MAAMNFQRYADISSDFESFEDVGKRVQATLEKCVKEHANVKDIVVVTHGDCVVAARLWGFGRDFTVEERTKLQDDGYPTYCSVTTLELAKDGTATCVRVTAPNIS